MQKVVFLDRDGTLNPDEKGYISSPDDFELFPYSAEAIELLHKRGFRVIVVTNQSGVARGLYTMEDVEEIHAKLHSLLRESGTDVDAIYVSPYHREGVVEPYNVEHDSRKPGLGMFQQADADFGIIRNQSWMVGDKYQDIQFGHQAGLRTILVRTGNGESEWLNKRNIWKCYPDFIVTNLFQAAQVICIADSQ